MNSMAALVATIHAASTPTHGRRIRRPIQYVAKTSAPPESGTTENNPHCPAIAFPAAIRIGSPGGYMGTIR